MKALLLNDVVTSKNTYDLSISSKVDTLGGQIKVLHVENLDNNPDDRFKKGKIDTMRPKKGVDDQVAINPNTKMTIEGKKGDPPLQIPLTYTIAFHELAEAYEKVEAGKQYPEAHKAAQALEEKLRDQRPYLKDHVPGAGSPRLIIKQ